MPNYKATSSAAEPKHFVGLAEHAPFRVVYISDQELPNFEVVYTRNPLPARLAKWLGMKVIFETYRFYTPSQLDVAPLAAAFFPIAATLGRTSAF